MPNVDVSDAPQTPSDAEAPKVPGLGDCRSGTPSVIHALGDLHGWAPSLITYLITNKLADISIDGRLLGSGGEVDAEAMEAFFGLSRKYPEAGLRGMPSCEDAINGEGHGSIKARWIANEDTAFVQIGDIFDRADHSELAAEIVRQLIVEAPNRVFAIVGNHEQFMLENAVENWYLNESRNAISDPSEFPENSSRKHTRFIPDISALTPKERAIQDIFPCYRLSTFTLFLTQAAAQQKSGFINRNMEEKLVEDLLSDGWGAYSATLSYIATLHENPVESIPGAMVALVIGENLFHHAEPGSHLNGLPDMLTSNDSGFGWFDYEVGGSIQNSPHSEFLWSRGASNGANNGSPKVASEINPLRESWPGLFRIVHGHSPTVSTDEFTKAMLRGVESASCSYLAQNMSDTPARGKASGIRVYNIDEGTSPVYYQGGQNPDSPTRVPMGLRLCIDQVKDHRVVVHTHEDPFLEVANARNILTDTRKLWSWKEGQFKITGKNKWPLDGAAISKADFDSCVVEFDDSIWIIRANTAGINLISRRLNGVPIFINLMRSLICEMGVDWKNPDKTTPALGHCSNEVFPNLIRKNMIPKYQGSWKVAEEIGLAAVGLKIADDGTAQIISLCGSITEGKKTSYTISTRFSTPKTISLSPNEGIHKTVRNQGTKPYMIHMGLSKPENILSYWEGLADDEPDYSQPSISFFPEKGGRWSWGKTEKYNPDSPDAGEEAGNSLAEKMSKGMKGIRDTGSSILSGVMPETKTKKKHDIREIKSNPADEYRPSRRQYQPAKSHKSRDIRDKPTQNRDIRGKTSSEKHKPEEKKTQKIKREEKKPSECPMDIQQQGEKITLTMRPNNEWLKKFGIKRTENQPTLEIIVTTLNKERLEFIFAQPTTGKPSFNWAWTDGYGAKGRPTAKKKDHGITGVDINKLLTHPGFRDILREKGVLK